MTNLLRVLFIVTGVGLASGLVSCTDPVRDQQIAALGPEDPAVPQGPEHRPGQPCLLCHSEGGPASRAPFAIAGTVYDKISSETGTAGVAVYLVDSSGGRRVADTNAAGNFFITQSEWSDLAYPFKVAVQKGNNTPQIMTTTVNREGSCNFCHRPGAGSYDAIPQVFATP